MFIFAARLAATLRHNKKNCLDNCCYVTVGTRLPLNATSLLSTEQTMITNIVFPQDKMCIRWSCHS